MIAEVKKAVRDWIVAVVADYDPTFETDSIVWGNQNAAAPAFPYIALFFTPTPNPAFDDVVQVDEDTAEINGDREALVELRIFTVNAMEIGYSIKRGTMRDDLLESLDSAEVSIFDVDDPRDITIQKATEIEPAAASSFSIRWIDSVAFDRDTIEKVVVDGEFDSGIAVVLTEDTIQI